MPKRTRKTSIRGNPRTQSLEVVWKSLPLPVLDNILTRLDEQDLAKLCRTSKTFCSIAKRFLYAGEWTLPKSTKLDQCLRINLDNARLLRFYRSTSFKFLQEIVSRPLQLDRLEINYDPDQLPDCNAVLKFTKSMHPQTQIKEIDLRQTDLLSKNSQLLLGSLQHFRGLESLRVLCRGRMARSLTLPNELNELRRLYLDECDQWGIDFSKEAVIEKCPNLESIHFHFSSMSSLPESMENEGWLNLLYPKYKHVFFQITANSRYDQMVSLYQESFTGFKKKDKIDVGFLEWLVRADIHFANQGNKRSHSVHDLRELEPNERNKALKIIQKMSEIVQKVPPDQKLGFRLGIFPSDSRDFYEPDSPRNSAELSKFIPKQTSYLNLFIKGSVHTKYIPAIVRSLRNLEHIVVSAYARNPFPENCENADEEYDSDGEPMYCLEPGAWCTRVAYSIRTDDKLESQKSWNLELRKGRRPRWIEVDYYNGGETSPLQESFKEEIERKNEGFVKEVNEWFKWSNSLKAVDFRIFAGRPWSFQYMAS